MCHGSPGSALFAALISTFGTLYMLYHIYSYDRFKSCVYKRGDGVRFVVVWAMIAGCSCFVAWNIQEIVVKYSEYYLLIPTQGVIVKPYQLWSKSHIRSFQIGYYILCLGWSFFLVVHMEEYLFWIYLIRTIRRRETSPWFNSIYFKIWCLGSVAVFGILFGSASIDIDNLDEMEGNIFFAGSILATLLALMSLHIVQIFPGFINEARSLGANDEIIEKLSYFKRLGMIRTFFRVSYALALLTLSSDSITHSKIVNHSPAAYDGLFILAIFSVFASTIISLLILLPRTLHRESGFVRQHNLMVGVQSYDQQAARNVSNKSSDIESNSGHGHSHDHVYGHGHGGTVSEAQYDGTPWGHLANRLALGAEDTDDLAAMVDQGTEDESAIWRGGGDGYAFEMPMTQQLANESSTPLVQPSSFANMNANARGSGSGYILPPGRAEKAVARFGSPLDVDVLNAPPDIRVGMSSSTVVRGN